MMEHSHIFSLLPSNSSAWSPGQLPPSPLRCPLGPLPVIYYSTLLCLGLPANILTVVVLSQLVLRRQKSSYSYLLALAAADILVLLLIVFVDFLLEDFILGAPLPPSLGKAVLALEFCSLHTSVWITVPLTVDRYVAVCHPLHYHVLSYPARARRVILAVYLGGLLSGAPYYWWPDLWRGAPGGGFGPGQQALVWAHCVAVYLVPCAVFLALNSAIVRQLHSRRATLRLRGRYSTGKTTAILLAVTSVFAALWAPRVIVILYRLYAAGPAPDPARPPLHLLADLANMLALLNTAVNFFLYCFISRRFRGMAAAAIAASLCCRKRLPPPAFCAGHSLSVTSSSRISPAGSRCIKMLVYQCDRSSALSLSPPQPQSLSPSPCHYRPHQPLPGGS
ncbi:probable G-protein coupled receptor 139 [Anguilla anguilla]|uniref:probable G-protein coupled receptor 139 n=1 Tax=Anguilla anguilla TaxID=7936 RepID=UPI0015A8B9EE|nr:probable G-protein coupled receptor 139 [Anguilla anguilla]